ncbi:hypothetical protein EGW08_022505, partial [Elysia chlorotica]
PTPSFYPSLQGCLNYTYGQDCSSNCSKNCRGSGLCHHKTGACTDGCIAGFMGEHCDIDCIDKMYGLNCSSRCSENCAGSGLCHYQTGACNDGCLEGFLGERCVIGLPKNISMYAEEPTVAKVMLKLAKEVATVMVPPAAVLGIAYGFLLLLDFVPNYEEEGDWEAEEGVGYGQDFGAISLQVLATESVAVDLNDINEDEDSDFEGSEEDRDSEGSEEDRESEGSEEDIDWEDSEEDRYSEGLEEDRWSKTPSVRTVEMFSDSDA